MDDDDGLNKIKLPLAEIRLQIVAMMKEGETEVSLGDYLRMLQALYRKKKEADKELGGS